MGVQVWETSVAFKYIYIEHVDMNNISNIRTSRILKIKGFHREQLSCGHGMETKQERQSFADHHR